MPIKIINYNPEKFCNEMDERIRFRKASVILSIFLFFCSMVVLTYAGKRGNMVAIVAASVAVVTAFFSLRNGLKSLRGLFRTNKVLIYNILADKLEPYIFLKDKKAGKVTIMISDREMRPRWFYLTFRVIPSNNIQYPVIDFEKNAVLVPEEGGNNNAE